MGNLMNEQKIIHTHTLKCLCLVVHFDEPAWHKNIIPWSVGKYKLPMDWKWQLSRPSGLHTAYTIKYALNTLRPRQDGCYLADDVLKCIFFNENVWILLKIPLKFVPWGPIKNIPALVQIMAWRRPGNKPLSETMLVFVPTHICFTRPQWVKLGLFLVITEVLNVSIWFTWPYPHILQGASLA